MNDPVINAVMAQVKHERFQRFRKSEQFSLGKLIYELKNMDRPNAGVMFSDGTYPGRLSSWRGSYDELAVVPEQEEYYNSLSDFVAVLESAVGKTFEGYKGGEFVMDEHSPVWVAEWGDNAYTAPCAVVYRTWVVIEIKEFDF